MKTFLTAVSILAILNLLAIGGLAGYLHATDRIDAQRIADIRELLTETISERDAKSQAAADAAEHDALQAAELERQGQPPVPAADILLIRLEQTQADVVRLEGIRREVEILQETLRRERRALDDERERLTLEREQFEQARRLVMQNEGNAQFRKALATYEALKPDRAHLALAQLIEQGEIVQVVDYLNAMQERTRTRIIDQFLEDQPQVATDLLERLRMRGLPARSPESSG